MKASAAWGPSMSFMMPQVIAASSGDGAAFMPARRGASAAPASPVVIQGRAIASTFWGKAWCDNVESYQDYSNRLPRGRSYVRSGAVIDLQIKEGHVSAKVMGSSRYNIEMDIQKRA